MNHVRVILDMLKNKNPGRFSTAGRDQGPEAI